jgi:hypothetical protein
MAILTTTVTRTFTRTKKEKTVSNVTASILSQMQANANASPNPMPGLSTPTFSNINIVGSPQFTPLEYTAWQESPGSPAAPDTVSTDQNPCLDSNGQPQHANGPWHLTSSTTTDGTPVWTAGGGGTANVTYTYDATWTYTAPAGSTSAVTSILLALYGTQNPAGTYNAVGVQSSKDVPVDETQTPQTKVEVYTSFAGGITCY